MEKVNEIVHNVLELGDDVEINMNTTREDIPEWDSFGQLAILSEIQDEYDVKFSVDEIQEMNSISSICDILSKRKVKGR